MRVVLAALVIVVMAGAVHAQDAGSAGGIGGGHKGRGSHQKSDQSQNTDKQKKAVDDGYRSAVKGMPDKEQPDPWKNVR